MSGLQVLHKGGKSDQARAFEAAMNRRLHARALDSYRVSEAGVVTNSVLLSARKAAWIMGALPATFESITAQGEVPIGVQQMILNPGLRNPQQLERARRRLSHLRQFQKERDQQKADVSAHRARLGSLAKLAAAHYRADPSAYHYLEGGVANLIFLAPSPLSYRSDCSQFCAAVYTDAGLPSPATVDALWASTFTMVGKGVVTSTPKMGDLGMYGSRTAPYHVEMYIGVPGAMFIGHGSPPIDSLTPGLPDYYLTYPFLDQAIAASEADLHPTEEVVPDLSGEESNAAEAATEGIVERDFVEDFEPPSMAVGFSGEAEGGDDAGEDPGTATEVEVASL